MFGIRVEEGEMKRRGGKGRTHEEEERKRKGRDEESVRGRGSWRRKAEMG